MSHIRIIGIPLDMGAGRRGVDMGVSAIRLAGLTQTLQNLGHHVEDGGNIEIPVVETLVHEEKIRYMPTIAETCRRVYEWYQDIQPHQIALALGGDHSISIGTIPGLAKHGRTGVIWIDAHTDINTPKTSPSGNIHGMPVAHLLGDGAEQLRQAWGGGPILRPEDIVYIGIRSVDREEKKMLQTYDITTFTMKDIDIMGMAQVAEKTLEQLQHLDRIHVSFDVDVLDPSIAPGVGTPVPGGLSYREAHLLMELLHDARVVTSLEMVEVNPILDIQNRTAHIAVEMAASLLGQSII